MKAFCPPELEIPLSTNMVFSWLECEGKGKGEQFVVLLRISDVTSFSDNINDMKKSIQIGFKL